MPELPEVETIRRKLEPPLRGLVLKKWTLTLPRILVEGKVSECEKLLIGQKLLAIHRRAKYLIWNFEKSTLVVHLGMTGQLTLRTPHDPIQNQFRRTVTGLPISLGVHEVDKHTHAVFSFSKEIEVLYRDVRTFGKFLFFPKGEWEKYPSIYKLGPEPLDCTARQLAKHLAQKSGNKNLKSFLLDQEIVAGVGNIYADEALFLAKLHPLQLSKNLTQPAWEQLAQSIQKVLNRGIQHNGTTFSDFRDPHGLSGQNQENLSVYGRGSLPCHRCQTKLLKIVVQSRSTVFCSQCQSP